VRELDPHTAADHLSRLYRLAWSLCGSPLLAEELTQETYARVLSRRRRLRDDGEFAYLARTLRNVFHDHWRSERRRPVLVGGDDLETHPSPRGDADPEAAAMAGEVYAAVAALPEPMRDVVAAVDVAGLSYQEAARELRIPVGTVMSRLHRARARLAGTLGEAGERVAA
jgi:RNA polymerase sigma-70 factor (ECF subfamily)